MNIYKLSVAIICLGLAGTALAQLRVEDYKGSALYRARNVMSGNLVRTTFYNYGLVGNIGEISGEWPIGTGNEYVGDVSPLVGVEFVHPSGDTLHSVTTSDGPRQNPDGPPGGGTFWGFEPLQGFAAPPIVGEDPKVAMSNQRSTWPDYWPDKLLTDSLDRNWQADPVDPGWSGHWNGYFGKDVTNADQESYFQMDDNSDMEWFQRTVEDTVTGESQTYYYYPARYDTSRRGLGLRVTVRGLQWSHFLAQDVIFWLYEITNISSYTYDKVTFGMMVGTLSGGRQDSEDDLAYFDLENDITYSWDGREGASPGWVPVNENTLVGYVGYAFLESPGNPYDGIDNDGDSESPGSPRLTPQVLQQLLQPRSFGPGQRLILIDYYTYQRYDTTFPATGPLVYFVRDQQHQLFPGQMVSEDGRNGIDDNFNGLIDERQDHEDLAYVDYSTGLGDNDILIDEARDDGIDNDSDWDPLTDDLGADGAALTGDPGEGDGHPTNGEPHFDKTDVDESDQIGLNAFEYFSPPGAVRMRDDEALWTRMEPGHFDVVSQEPEDGDFIYGSGYFPLRPGQTERFSMALAYGEDFEDLQDNKITVQQIYNENYNFARPPEKPTLWAVPGDGRVTLYWDDIAESSFDPVTGHDFEGYKIYRATDPAFNEVFSITDALGRRVFHKPIAQFDLNNGNAGIFPVIRNNVIYFLGNDTGLEHTWTDTTVENGQTYYYAIVAYDHGDVEKEILPAENSKTIVVDEAGNVTLDINTAQIVPRAPAAGYTPPQISPLAHVSGNATGAIAIELVDPRLVKDNRQYDFLFSENADTSEPQAINYSIVRHAPNEPDSVIVSNRPLIPDDNLINQADRFAAYYDSLFNLYPGSYDPAQFFRVCASDIFDGQRAYILIPRQVALIQQVSGWADTSRGLYEYRFGLTNYSQYFLVGQEEIADYQIEWYDAVVDTALYFNWYNLFTLPAVPVNFRVKNLNTNQYIHFAFDEVDSTANGIIDNAEVIMFLNQDTLATWAVEFRNRPATGHTVRPEGGDVLTFRLYQPYSGADRFEYSTSSEGISAANVDLARIRVYPNPYVAANPQESSNPFNEGRGERRITFTHLPPDCKIRIYSVRGELVQTLEHRSADYSGAAPPPGYDPREHDEFEGIENWDLRSKDGLNVAYGIYLYNVESPFGKTTGRFAVIK